MFRLATVGARSQWLSPFRGRTMFTTVASTWTVLDACNAGPLSPDFAANKAAMDSAVSELQASLAETSSGGGDVAVARHRARGKMLPRERIDALLDPGAPFLELSQLAGKGLYGTPPSSDYPQFSDCERLHFHYILLCRKDDIQGFIWPPLLFSCPYVNVVLHHLMFIRYTETCG
jgi:hypothetical protein